jgi:hypothetical protein
MDTFHSDNITEVCRNKEPAEVSMRTDGMLSLTSVCKADSKSAVLQTHELVKYNYYNKSNDFVAKVNLLYDSREYLSSKVNLSSINLHSEFKHIASYLNDLKIGSPKASEVENMIKEPTQRQFIYLFIYGCIRGPFEKFVDSPYSS